MVLFRVDRRQYTTGDKVSPVGEYTENIDTTRTEVELSLNENDYNIERKNSLFLFCNISSALLFWL